MISAVRIWPLPMEILYASHPHTDMEGNPPVVAGENIYAHIDMKSMHFSPLFFPQQSATVQARLSHTQTRMFMQKEHK